jgi:hydrogenase expression/formation protein HypD
LIAPGHVCSVTGLEEYEALAREYRVPVVVGGFEPLDLLEAVRRLVVLLEEGRAEVHNAYSRSVTREGNRSAQAIVERVFEPADRCWRGLGLVPGGGLRLREEYAEWDAEHRFEIEAAGTGDSPECIAARVLQGLSKPVDCPAFAVRCTPESPLGAPMVSNEGACAAYYRYRRPQECAACPA